METVPTILKIAGATAPASALRARLLRYDIAAPGNLILRPLLASDIVVAYDHPISFFDEIFNAVEAR